MSTFGFRLRLNTNGFSLHTDEREMRIPFGETVTLTLKASGERTLRNATRWIFRAGGFLSEADATLVAHKLRRALLRVIPHVHAPLDVGKNNATSSIAKSIRKEMEQASGIQILDDIHGIVVFSEDRPESVFSMQANALASHCPNSFEIALQRAASINQELSAQAELAIELYASALACSLPSARLIQLMTVLEVLALAGSNKLSKSASKKDKLAAFAATALNEPPNQSVIDWYDIRNDIVHEGAPSKLVHLTSVCTDAALYIGRVLSTL